MRERSGRWAEHAMGGHGNTPDFHAVDAEAPAPGEGRTALPGLNQFLN